MAKCRYRVILKDGSILIDGEGNKSRYISMVKACNGELFSSVHSGTIKVWLNRALGNIPKAVLLEDGLSKSESLDSERKSHRRNGIPSLNSTNFYLLRLEQLGWKEDELHPVTQVFIRNLLKHGDNASKSRADYEIIKKWSQALREIKEIFQINI